MKASTHCRLKLTHTTVETLISPLSTTTRHTRCYQVIEYVTITPRLSLVSSFEEGYSLSSVSLVTMIAINMDRLSALLLGIKYKLVVSLKRTVVATVIIWFVCILNSAMNFWNYLILLWCSDSSLLIDIRLLLYLDLLHSSTVIIKRRYRLYFIHITQ